MVFVVKDIIVIFRKIKTILILISFKRYFSHPEKSILSFIYLFIYLFLFIQCLTRVAQLVTNNYSTLWPSEIQNIYVNIYIR